MLLSIFVTASALVGAFLSIGTGQDIWVLVGLAPLVGVPCFFLGTLFGSFLLRPLWQATLDLFTREVE